MFQTTNQIRMGTCCFIMAIPLSPSMYPTAPQAHCNKYSNQADKYLLGSTCASNQH